MGVVGGEEEEIGGVEGVAEREEVAGEERGDSREVPASG